jgi:hypothetical protein
VYENRRRHHSASLFQGVALEVEVLLGGRDAGITEQTGHAADRTKNGRAPTSGTLISGTGFGRLKNPLARHRRLLLQKRSFLRSRKLRSEDVGLHLAWMSAYERTRVTTVTVSERKKAGLGGVGAVGSGSPLEQALRGRCAGPFSSSSTL